MDSCTTITLYEVYDADHSLMSTVGRSTTPARRARLPMPLSWDVDVTPDFKDKIECSYDVCSRTSFHTYL
jgi:hypothetical protein